MAGAVVSDLHIFAERSRIEEYDSIIISHAATSDFMVLDGDIFDFEWTMLASVESTVKHAVAWLESLVENHPACQFYYILGNHDSHPLFVRELQNIRKPNFQWSENYFIIGDNLFIHGDVRNLDPQLRRKDIKHPVQPRGRFLSRTYEVVLKSGVHNLAYFTHNRHVSVRVLYSKLKKSGLLDRHNIKHVYFGHTHFPFNDMRFRNITFHNTGTIVKGFKTNFIVLDD